MKTLVLICSVVAVLAAIVTPAFCEVIAEYTGGATNGLWVAERAGTQWRHAQAFTATGSPTVTEVQVNIVRWAGSNGTFIVSLVRDNNGAPTGTVAGSISKNNVDIPMNNAYVSFKWNTNQPVLSPGRWWIVCRVSSDCDADIIWQGRRWMPGDNYGGGDDVITSLDRGVTWPVLQGQDMNFRVFGQRTGANTNTTITASPASVTTTAAGVTGVSTDHSHCQGRRRQSRAGARPRAADQVRRNASKLRPDP